MANFPVDLTTTTGREVNGPRFEIIQFTTQGTGGDWYDTKKLGFIQGAFASNITTDSKEIRVHWALEANGQPRIRIIQEEASTSGYLLIIGKK